MAVSPPIFQYFLKSVEKIWVSLKNLARIMDTLHEDLCTFVLVSRWILRGIRHCSDNTCWDNRRTHVVKCRKTCLLWDKVEQYCTAGETTHDNIACGHCVLYTYVYKHTHIIRNIYCFYAATIVARKRLGIMLYVHFLSLSTCKITLDYSESLHHHVGYWFAVFCVWSTLKPK
jgi:hypothetical protein